MKFKNHQQDGERFDPNKILTDIIDVAENHISNNSEDIPDIERTILFDRVIDEH